MTVQQNPKTFVFIHGAWHGGWCWRRVADRLQQRGHTVFAPTLTGLGERSHLLSKDIDLDTHITDIVNVFRWEDLKDACLVAHSYAGRAVSGALEHVRERVSSVVFLDAHVPQDGQRFIEMSEMTRKGLVVGRETGALGYGPPKAEAFHVNEKDRAWVDSKTVPQPNGTAFQAIRLTGAREQVAKKTYIRAPIFAQSAFDGFLAAAKADPGWKTYEVGCGHDVMIDDPDRLVEILLEVA